MARIERILFKLNVTARTDLKCGFLIARNISTQKSLINGNFILLKPEYKSQLEIRKKGPYDPFISLNRMKSISRNRRELHTLEYLENIHIEKSKEKFKINSKDKPINTPFDSQIAVPSQVIGELLIAEWKLNLNRGENLPTKLPIVRFNFAY